MPAVANSILDTTKKMIGVDPENTEFDIDIITHINSVFAILQQLGVGPVEGFAIEDNTTLWSVYTIDNLLVNSVKTFMYLQVRVWFDPPSTSADLTAKKEQLLELQWRLNVAVDTIPHEPEVPEEELDTVVVWTTG